MCKILFFLSIVMMLYSFSVFGNDVGPNIKTPLDSYKGREHVHMIKGSINRVTYKFGNEHAQLIKKSRVVFDENGEVIEKEIYDPDDSIIESIGYEIDYNDQNRIDSIKKNNNGMFQSLTEYQFNNENILVSGTVYDVSNKIQHKKSYIYEKTNRIKKKIFYDQSGDITSIVRYIYDNDSIKEVEYNENNTWNYWKTYQYDNDGNVVQTEVYTGITDEKISLLSSYLGIDFQVRHEIFQYNVKYTYENNLIVGEFLILPDDTIKINYEYDENQNCIQILIYMYEHKFGEEVFVLKSIIDYEIDYREVLIDDEVENEETAVIDDDFFEDDESDDHEEKSSGFFDFMKGDQ